MEFIPITPQKAKPSHCNKSVAADAIALELSEDAQRDALPVESILEAPFEGGVLIDWVCIVKRPTEFFVLHVANEHASVAVFLQAAKIPVCHLKCVFLTM